MPKTSQIVSFLLLLGGAFCSTAVKAQKETTGWADYSYIKNATPWLTGENAAGLKELPIDNISVAEVYFRKDNGKFVNYFRSDNSYEAGANIESFYRLKPGIVLFGKISYENFRGKNMGGSAFINPYHAPFDIVEFTDSTRGTKNRELYNLTGAVSADVYNGIILGGKIDFFSANYAKDKDLRHKNKLSDLHLSLGLSYRINKTFDVGANYFYRRRTEGLEFSMYGTTDKQYKSLIDYGGFYGKTEVFGETGYTTKGTEKPLFDKYHGASLQLDVRFSPKLSLFNEFSFKDRDGYYGISSTGSIIYSTHSSTLLSYKGTLNYHSKKNLHSLNINLNSEKLDNLENVYKEEKPQGSSTSIITYYDPLKVSDKELTTASMEYTANIGINEYNPSWVLKAGFDFLERKQTSSVYPFFRKQAIRQTGFILSAVHNIVRGINMYSIMAGADYRNGSGNVNTDGVYVAPGESHVAPPSSDTYLFREYEYLTSDQLRGNLGFKYSRLFTGTGIKGYAAVNYSLTKAFDTSHLEGDSHTSLLLTVGCTF